MTTTGVDPNCEPFVMITKILFTIAIIAAVVFFSRYAGASKRRASAGGGDAPSALRITAYAIIGLLVLGAALWIILEWRDAHEIVRVRVINSDTGAGVLYEAYRSDVESRSFRTLDGRRVNLADVERLEIGGE